MPELENDRQQQPTFSRGCGRSPTPLVMNYKYKLLALCAASLFTLLACTANKPVTKQAPGGYSKDSTGDASDTSVVNTGTGIITGTSINSSGTIPGKL